jgi:hypothetical protein
MHLTFRFAPESEPSSVRKLKVEINTREHLSLLPLKRHEFRMQNPWYSGSAQLVSFEPEELYGTKLRALLQRRKNRDLFDLNEGLKNLNLDLEKLMQCFEHYLQLEGTAISRAVAEQRLLERLEFSLTEDILPMLPVGITFDDNAAIAAFGRVWTELVPLFRGESWKLSGNYIKAIRNQKYPDFLR